MVGRTQDPSNSGEERQARGEGKEKGEGEGEGEGERITRQNGSRVAK